MRIKKNYEENTNNYNAQKEKQWSSITNYKEHNDYFRQKTGKDFDKIYTSLYPKIIFFTKKMFLASNIDLDKAEDVTTDTLMTAFEKISQYDKNRSNLTTWVHTIAKNSVLQEIQKTKKTLSMDIKIDDEGTTIKDFIYDTEDNQLELHENLLLKSEIIKKEINNLKEPLKQAIIMRELEHMTYQEMSDKLNIQIETVKSRIRCGRLKLIQRTRETFEKMDKEIGIVNRIKKQREK